jgi:organic hydroperoxide reductase OsmC/OhrA
VAACLLGTFRGALAVRGVDVGADALTAEAIGDVIVEHGVPLLKRVTVQYHLSVPPGADRSVIEHAHSVHHRACAVSRSLEAAIAITTELELAWK